MLRTTTKQTTGAVGASVVRVFDWHESVQGSCLPEQCTRGTSSPKFEAKKTEICHSIQITCLWSLLWTEILPPGQSCYLGYQSDVWGETWQHRRRKSSQIGCILNGVVLVWAHVECFFICMLRYTERGELWLIGLCLAARRRRCCWLCRFAHTRNLLWFIPQCVRHHPHAIR